MKILHLNSHESFGGAAIAAKRLHISLRDMGIDSKMAVATKHTDSPHVIELGSTFSRRILRPIAARIERTLISTLYSKPTHAGYTTFSLFPSLLHNYVKTIPKDIVHLHWLGDGFFPLTSLHLIQNPIVWTLHDTWPFTGGCHFSSTNCQRYLEECGYCPELCSRHQRDLSHWCWLKKNKLIKRIKPTIVALSKEYVHLASQSKLLQNCRIEHIPNCINTDIFRPIPQTIARSILGLPQDKKIMLFGAIGATSDHNKGFDLLQKALFSLAAYAEPNALAVVFGSSSMQGELPYPTHFLGHLYDEISLTLAYSAADIFICPSRQESFSNTVLESLACGTPVAAFSVGGIPDMIDHQVNGWLAKPQDTEDLAQGIAYILQDGDRRIAMGKEARSTAEKNYAAPIIAARYINLYNDILQNK